MKNETPSFIISNEASLWQFIVFAWILNEWSKTKLQGQYLSIATPIGSSTNQFGNFSYTSKIILQYKSDMSHFTRKNFQKELLWKPVAVEYATRNDYMVIKLQHYIVCFGD